MAMLEPCNLYTTLARIKEMLDDTQKAEVSKIVTEALDNAEKVWKSDGYRIAMDSAAVIVEKREIVPSRIPSHPNVDGDEPKVEKFIALVADMRKSSQHLLCAIGDGAKASMLERVYYETSALLPALERTIGYEEGSVTEYLGDGVLALFKVNKTSPNDMIYAAHEAAKNCVGDARDIVNKAIAERYKLPEIDVGVGLSMSDALVSLFGLNGQRHPKVFGSCVYYATKLSGGKNEIYVDKSLNENWPTSKGGTLKFLPKKIKGVDGFLLSRKDG